MMFDSHCHLSSPQLASQIDDVMQRARDANVTRVLNIADSLPNSREVSIQAQELQSRGFDIFATVGVHPQKALEFDGSTIDELRELSNHPLVCAIGEIGLDYVYDDRHPEYPGATREVQESVFRAQLDLAVELNLPVVIHNRDADEALLKVVEDYAGKVRGVFHCFGSSTGVAMRVLDLGFHLGFTGLITFKNAETVRDVARLCPLEKTLIETDAPYLAPVPFRGKINEPSFVPLVAKQLAEIHNLPVEEIGEITTRNACELFRVE
jgi:TatD DNase family protein